MKTQLVMKMKSLGLIAVLLLVLGLTSCEDTMSSFSSEGKIRFVNATNFSWEGARLRNLVEYTGDFGPSKQTDYLTIKDSGTYTLEVLSGSSWISIRTGVNVSIGNKYTITIESANSAKIEKD